MHCPESQKTQCPPKKNFMRKRQKDNCTLCVPEAGDTNPQIGRERSRMGIPTGCRRNSRNLHMNDKTTLEYNNTANLQKS
jgi:hypothetical protein